MEKNTHQPSPSLITRIWSKVTSFLQNSIVNLMIGVLITVLFFYFIERKEIDTEYAISNIELIAAQTSDAPELQLYWADEKISDIYSVKIAFWNSGKQFLNMDGVSKSNPIHIVVPKNIRVLFAEVVETSRQSLRFSTVYNQENILTEGIVINILDDEAMEKMDGGVIKILFTGTPNGDFAVQGRILGNAKGFQKTQWRDSNSWLEILSLGLGYIQGIFMFNMFRKRRNPSLIWRVSLIILLLTYIGLTIYLIYAYQQGIYTFNFPNWVN